MHPLMRRVTAAWSKTAGWWLRQRTIRCLVCGQTGKSNLFANGCCPECNSRLQPRRSGFCPGCGLLFALDGPVSLCLECRSLQRPWQGFGFFAAYEGLLREILLQFKFQEGLGYSRILQSLMLQAYTEHLDPFVPDCILPVPLHPARLTARGYNQSLELGRRLARELQVRIRPKGLVRLHNTPPQAGLNRKERLVNLQGAFHGNQDLVQGRSILLIDDIYTTGTTLTACAKALKKVGCAEIRVLVLARAQA